MQAVTMRRYSSLINMNPSGFSVRGKEKVLDILVYNMGSSSSTQCLNRRTISSDFFSV